MSPKRRRHYTISLSVIIGIFSHLKKERKRRRERKRKILQINLWFIILSWTEKKTTLYNQSMCDYRYFFSSLNKKKKRWERKQKTWQFYIESEKKMTLYNQSISLCVIIGIFSLFKKERKRRWEWKRKTLQIYLWFIILSWTEKKMTLYNQSMCDYRYFFSSLNKKKKKMRTKTKNFTNL